MLPGIISLCIFLCLKKTKVGLDFQIGILDMIILCCDIIVIIMFFSEIYDAIGKETLEWYQFLKLIKTIPGIILIILPNILMYIGIFK